MKKILLPILVLSLAIGSFVFLIKNKKPNKAIVIDEKSWVVKVVKTPIQTLSPSIKLYGRIESPQTSNLVAALNAEIVNVSVLEGMIVKKNQLLISLDNSDSKLKLQQHQADLQEIKALIESEKNTHANNLKQLPLEKALLVFNQKDVQRSTKLKQQKVMSQANLDNSLQTVERQKISLNKQRLIIKNHQARLKQLTARRSKILAQIGLAKLELKRTKIVAPFAGIIAQVMTAKGERVNLGQKLIKIYNKSFLEVRTQIPKIYENTIYQALADSYNIEAKAIIHNKKVNFQLNRISGEIKQASGGVDALFKIIGKHTNLRIGQFVELQVKLPVENQVIVIPYEAIYGNNKIYKYIDGRMQMVFVTKIGEYMGDISGKPKLLIRSTKIKNNDQIIVTKLPNAIDGLKVEIDN
jgi:multidrug efflux pump subunit AcrA (membrane-fusion protein)